MMGRGMACPVSHGTSRVGSQHVRVFSDSQSTDLVYLLDFTGPRGFVEELAREGPCRWAERLCGHAGRLGDWCTMETDD